jgi:MSHA biogenesis protein MshP
MCPDPISSCRHRCAPRRAAATQRGFSIVSAIFLLVVLSVLGAFMATFSSVQHVSSALDVRGAQAYQAARAGIEWGTYRVLRNSSCAGSQVLNDVPGFVVTVECVASGIYTEGVTGVTVYRITSTASSGTVGGIGYVERQLQATIGK